MNVQEETEKWLKKAQKSGRKITDTDLKKKILSLQKLSTKKGRYIDETIPKEDTSIIGKWKKGIQESPEAQAMGNRFFPSWMKEGKVNLDPLSLLGKVGTELAGEATGTPREERGGLVSDVIEDPSMMLMGAGGPVVSTGMKLLGQAGKAGKLGGKFGATQAPQQITRAAELQGFTQPSMQPFVGSTGNVASGIIPRVAEKGLAGAMEQIPSSVVSGMARDENAVGEEMAISGALSMTPSIVKGIAKPLGEFVKDFTASASNRSKELLEHIGSSELKEFSKQKRIGDYSPEPKLKELREFDKRAKEVADNMISTVDELEGRYQELNPSIQQAIGEMKPMDTKELTNLLRSNKRNIPANKAGYEEDIKINNQLDGILNRIQQVVNVHNPVTTTQHSIKGLGEGYSGRSSFLTKDYNVSSPQGTTIPAKAMYDIRKMLDKGIDYSKQNYATDQAVNYIKDFRSSSRKMVKGALEDNAKSIGNKQYKNDMAEFHELLSFQDDFNTLLGPRKSDVGNVDRAVNLLTRAGATNQLDKRHFVERLGKVMNTFKKGSDIKTDLSKDANFLRMSREYTKGRPMIVDLQTGGKNMAMQLGESKLGKLTGLATTSPKIAPSIVGAVDYTGDVMSQMYPYMKTSIGQMKQPAVNQWGNNE